MPSVTNSSRFWRSALHISPKEIKQVAGLMALRQHTASDSPREQKSEQLRLDQEDQALQKAINLHFQKEAAAVDALPERDQKSDEDLWNELQYRDQLRQEHRKKEAERIAEKEAEGRSPRRYYQRRKGSFKMMLVGSMLIGLSYGLYEQSLQAKKVRHSFVLGEAGFATTPCTFAIGPDRPSEELTQVTSLLSQKVYRLFARCAVPGFLHVEYQQSLPASWSLNIPISATDNWTPLQVEGKVLALYLSGSQNLRLRFAYSQEPLSPENKIDNKSEEKLDWIREHHIPLLGE